MSDVTVRRAEKTDMASLCLIYHEFHEFHVRGVPHRLKSQGDYDDCDFSGLTASLADIMRSPDAALFVAEQSGELIGLAEVYCMQDDRDNRLIVAHRYGCVQSLMVRESSRRQGVGKLLMEAAEQWAKEKGVTEIRLDVWEFGEGPLGFYEKLGYRTIKRSLYK
jgi:GNAT superfamily N-acetyltransferase